MARSVRKPITASLSSFNPMYMLKLISNTKQRCIVAKINPNFIGVLDFEKRKNSFPDITNGDINKIMNNIIVLI